jgi:hypothetical protein
LEENNEMLLFALKKNKKNNEMKDKIRCKT